MLIAQISDTHIAGLDKKAYGIVPTAENLACCVDHINNLNPQPDVVLITGDITYSGEREEAEYAASLLEKLAIPYYLIPGNHDKRSTLWSVFAENACPSQSENFLNYVLDEFDIRLIGIDSTTADGPGGMLCKARISWLTKELKKETQKPTIIFMHHPPAKFGVLETDEDGFVGADVLSELLKKQCNIQAILCGHIHLTAHLVWAGTVIKTAPSMGLQLVLDLTLAKPSAFTLAAPGYLLHYYNPEKNLVTHSITVQGINDPYSFREYPGIQ